jgi:flagellar hook assembly protein FlgD
MIIYSLVNNQPQQTSLIIYNFRGEVIKTLVNEEKTGGAYKIIWDGTDDHHVPVSSGVYLSILKSGTFKSVKKMIKIK